MPENADGLAHDEEANAQTVASRRIETCERLENPGHFVPCDTDPSVIHVDADALADVTATEENAATGLRVLDRVANQVAQDGAEKKQVAVNRGGGLDYTNADSLL
jgi:hypothetical protein